MKNIGVLIKTCLYKEGLIIFLITGIIFYFIAFMDVYYGSANSDPMSDVVRVFMGLGICSVSAILAVIMASGIRALETRKTISLFPGIRKLILQAAFLVCILGAVFVLPYFYLVGFRSFKALAILFVSFSYTYGLTLAFGVLFAKYISPALSFALVLLVMAMGLFLIKTTNHFNVPIIIVGVVCLCPLFIPLYWLKRKQELLVDDGQYWATRLAARISGIMHFPQHASLVGTVLLNNGDSIRAMIKRSLIVLALSSVFLVCYFFSIRFRSSSSLELLIFFCIAQIIYVELGRGFKKIKSIWLLSDGDRAGIFTSRARLHAKLSAIHYGFSIVILSIVLMIVPFTHTPENISILIIILYYMIAHLISVSIPSAYGNFSVFPFLYFPAFFGKKVFEVEADGSFVLNNNPFELFLVFGFPVAVILIVIFAKNKIPKYDFTKKLQEASFLRAEGNL